MSSRHAEHLEEAIGPREVGGRYRDGYWGEPYTVVAIDPGPHFWITIKWDDGRVVSHATGWDNSRDKVLEQP